MTSSLVNDAPPPRFRWLVQVLLAACLLAPSIWMIATIPPLWRDVDAYNQVTRSPAIATYNGNGALYCFAARLPLGIGALFGNTSPHPARPGLQPPLTDSGIFVLVVSQHLALAGAAFFFITTIAQLSWVRLALGILWMTLAPFYTYAQCIGSETISIVCVLLLATIGWRLARRERARPRTWLLFHLVLLAAVLARHVNLWLALLLPLTFLFGWLQACFRLAFFSINSKRRRLRILVSWKLRRAVLALACGLACFAAADLSVRTICHTVHLQFHSHAGPTFLWRLAFLKDLPEAERNQLLATIASRRAHSPDTLRLLQLVRETFDRGESLDPAVFRTEGRALLANPGNRGGGGRLARALNDMASAFLWPTAPALLRVARSDFARARLVTPGEIDQFLFATTAFYFQHPDLMPEAATLVTFRGTNANEITAMPKHHRYFGVGRKLTYNRCLLLWMALLAILLVLQRSHPVAARLSSYAVSLTIAGLLMMFSTCLLGELLPRYTVPMWELTVISLLVVLGSLIELLSVDLRQRSLRMPLR